MKIWVFLILLVIVFTVVVFCISKQRSLLIINRGRGYKKNILQIDEKISYIFQFWGHMGPHSSSTSEVKAAPANSH